MPDKEISFRCPSCGHGFYEEIRVDITASTTCTVEQRDNGFKMRYGTAVNSVGHVDRYQCRCCGYLIIDHNSPHTEDGMNELALVAALKELSAPIKKGDMVSFAELIQRIGDQYETLSGQELANSWNELFPEQVVYEGDSLFWVQE